MIRVHASALNRLRHCLGSQGFPATAEVEQSDSAREGDAAHSAAMILLHGGEVPKVAPNGVEIDAEMREAVAEYAQRIGPVTPAHVAWVEESCDWYATDKIQIACRIDAATLTAEKIGVTTLDVTDLKYGWRLVDVEDNWQLIAGAVGILRKHFGQDTGGPMAIYAPPTRVRLNIFQPRPYHPDGAWRSVTMTLDELIAAHDAIVYHLSALPSDKLETGAHCEYCPGGILGTCPAYLAAVGNAVDVATRGGAMEVPPALLGREMVNLKRAAAVLKQRLDWAEDIVKREIEAGRSVPGWALEVQRGHTKWKGDPDELQKLTNVDIYEKRSLVSPAEAKRRGISEEFYAEHTTRPVTGKKLVRRDADAYVRQKVGKK